jgi:iron complex outermembrane receptor protein
LQFVDLGGGVTAIQLRNAAEVKTSGIEASARVQATENLTIGGNVGILDAEFTSFPDAAGVGVNFDGNRLPNAPEFTGAIWVDYHLTLPSIYGAVDMYGEFSHRDASFTSARNNQALDGITSRDVFNARMTYVPDTGNWSAGLWARNLFDEDYTDLHGRDFLGNQFVRRGAPQTWGGEIKVAF